MLLPVYFQGNKDPEIVFLGIKLTTEMNQWIMYFDMNIMYQDTYSQELSASMGSVVVIYSLSCIFLNYGDGVIFLFIIVFCSDSLDGI